VIVQLVLKNDWNGVDCFNVINPSPFPYKRLFDQVRSFGFDMSHIDYKDWRLKLFETLENTGVSIHEANALFPVAAQFTPSWIMNLKNPIYSNANVLSCLRDSVKFPDLEKTVSLYLTYFIKCGFINPPDHLSLKFENESQKLEKLTRTNRNH
jgi:hypothetical protein